MSDSQFQDVSLFIQRKIIKTQLQELKKKMLLIIKEKDNIERSMKQVNKKLQEEIILKHNENKLLANDNIKLLSNIMKKDNEITEIYKQNQQSIYFINQLKNTIESIQKQKQILLQKNNQLNLDIIKNNNQFEVKQKYEQELKDKIGQYEKLLNNRQLQRCQQSQKLNQTMYKLEKLTNQYQETLKSNSKLIQEYKNMQKIHEKQHLKNQNTYRQLAKAQYLVINLQKQKQILIQKLKIYSQQLQNYKNTDINDQSIRLQQLQFIITQKQRHFKKLQQKYQSQIACLQVKASNLQNEYNKKAQKNLILHNSMEQLKITISSQNKQISQYKLEINNIKSQFQQKYSFNELQKYQILQKNHNFISNLQKQLDRIREQLKHSQTQKNDLQHNFQKLEKQYDATIIQLLEERQKLFSQVKLNKNSQNQLETLKRQNRNLKQQITNNNQSYRQKQLGLQKLLSQIVFQNQQLSKSLLKSTQLKYTQQSSQMIKLKQQQDYEQQLKQRKMQIQNLQIELGIAKSDINKSQIRLQQKQNQIQKKDKQIMRLRKQLEIVQQNYIRMQKQYDQVICKLYFQKQPVKQDEGDLSQKILSLIHKFRNQLDKTLQSVHDLKKQEKKHIKQNQNKKLRNQIIKIFDKQEIQPYSNKNFNKKSQAKKYNQTMLIQIDDQF